MVLRTLFAICFALVAPSPSFAVTDNALAIEVWKSPTCGCCGKWVEHIEANGFAVTAKNTSPAMLERIKRQAGIGEDLASCHTGLIGGYAIEGHVPAADIKKLLEQRPEAAGLAVPGMPIGAPGMEAADSETEPYDVLLVKKDGSVEVFARH